MISFQHLAPPLRLFHGPESLGQIGRELDRLNSKRAVIFCGTSLARQGTLLDVVRGAMGDRCAGVCHTRCVSALKSDAFALKILGTQVCGFRS